MFPQTINTAPTADEKVARLVKQASLNLSMHLRRLASLSNNFLTSVESIEGVQRDYLISVLYTINETLAVLNFTGSQEHVDAIFLANLNAREYYDEAINIVHSGMVESEAIAPFEAAFAEELKLLKPDLNPPMEDELGDDVALTDAERAELNGSADLSATPKPDEEFTDTKGEDLPSGVAEYPEDEAVSGEGEKYPEDKSDEEAA